MSTSKLISKLINSFSFIKLFLTCILESLLLIFFLAKSLKKIIKLFVLTDMYYLYSSFSLRSLCARVIKTDIGNINLASKPATNRKLTGSITNPV